MRGDLIDREFSNYEGVLLRYLNITSNIHTKGGGNQYHLKLYRHRLKTRKQNYYKATPCKAMYGFHLQRALACHF